MSIIIKLKGLPLEAGSVDVRRYFLGLTIPDGGVHIVGGDEGTVFIEFASDEDARQAMARGDGSVLNSSIKLLLSSRSEMASVIESARQQKELYLQQQQQYLQQANQHLPALQQQTHFIPQQLQQQQQQQHQQPNLPQQTQPSPFIDPRLLSQNYQGMLSALNQAQQPQSAPMQPLILPPITQGQTMLNPVVVDAGCLSVPSNLSNNGNSNRNQSPDNRGRMSSMRGGNDKLFANKRCVLAASNIPYRATSKDIIEFLSEFDIDEDCIRRRYNQKGQPTADAKIAFPTPDAAVKALKMMNKKSLCGRPVFLKPV